MGDTKFTDDLEIKEFLGDKLKKIDQKLAIIWAINCVKHILKYNKYKNKEISSIIKRGYDWKNNKATISEVREAALKAHKLARETDSLISTVVMRAVGQAVATGHVLGHAIHSSTYSAKVVFYIDGNKKTLEERKWQKEELIRLIEELKE